MRLAILATLLLAACGSKLASSELGTSGGRFGADVAVATGGSLSTGGLKATGHTTIGTTGGTSGTGGIAATGGVLLTIGATNPKLVAKAITSAGEDACALLTDGTLECWGYNDYGQLGSGTATTSGCYCSSTPGAVAGVTNAVAIATGGFHTCAALEVGTIQCWGLNIDGV